LGCPYGNPFGTTLTIIGNKGHVLTRENAVERGRGMTQTKRMRIGALAMICVFLAGSAAASPQAISSVDAQRYEAAFEAVDRGDFIDAQVQASDITDQSLSGYITFSALMHPTAHKADYSELTSWLARFADLPGADRIYALAAKRKPADAPPPPRPLLASLDWSTLERTARRIVGLGASDKGRAAREAFYSGDAERALALAPGSGERWIAGLSAYRLKKYALAETYMDEVARDEAQDPWLRSGAAYWAARSAEQDGASDRAADFLQMAARNPDTFYGMIAARQVALKSPAAASQVAQAAASIGQFVLASYSSPNIDLASFIKTDVRAHRAAALAQIGRSAEAGLELRAGLTLANSDAERQQWTALIMSLDGTLKAGAARERAQAEYPTPLLEPRSGFTIDKALVYAIVRQESRFNPAVVSPAGAVGLMQLMPEAAARAAGDDKLKADMTPLFDPAFNLRVGQDYVTWLMERGVGYDLLRTVAAYNGGPGTLQKTAQMLGDDPDSLLLIECLPSQETRAYVEKVVTAYWTYRDKFGEENKTLDALASGAKFVDARLDR
jgi:soluble lytic murein transglycosylase-like protein